MKTLTLISLILLTTFSQLKCSNDSLRSNEFKFTIYSEGKTYIGTFNTSKYSKKLIEDIYSLIQIDLHYTYTLKKAIETIENNQQRDAFDNAMIDELGISELKKRKIENYYHNDKYTIDSTRISNLKFTDKKWNYLKNETLNFYSSLNNSLQQGIRELKYIDSINYKGSKDTCLKLVKLLKSNDTVARLDLWGEHWGRSIGDRLRSLDIDPRNINDSNIGYIDNWVKFDIYCFIYWDNCSDYNKLLDEMTTVQNRYKYNVLENSIYIPEFKKIFIKLKEVDL